MKIMGLRHKRALGALVCKILNFVDDDYFNPPKVKSLFSVYIGWLYPACYCKFHKPNYKKKTK